MTGRRSRGKEARVTLQPGPHGCGRMRRRAPATFPTSTPMPQPPPGSAPCSLPAMLGPGDPPLPPPAAAGGRPADTPLPSPSHAASEDLGDPPAGEWEGGTQSQLPLLHPQKTGSWHPHRQGLSQDHTTPTQGLHEPASRLALRAPGVQGA